MRARFREGFERRVPLARGAVHTVRWDLCDVAHVFARGARLGLAVRSDWFPVFARNPGTLEPMRTATRTAVQRHRIHSGPGRVSALRPYQVPLEALADAGPEGAGPASAGAGHDAGPARRRR